MDTSRLVMTDIDPTMKGIYKFIAEILLDYSNRIEELSFAGTTVSHMATHIDQLASHRFLILKVFHVCLSTRFARYNPTETLPFTSIIQHMPALNSLAIVGFSHSDQQFAQLNLPWENLTELIFSKVFSSQETLNMLGCASRLQSVTISVNIFTRSTETTAALNLPSMREMRLTFHYPWQKFYYSMVCPSLKILYASWGGDHEVADMPLSAFSSLKELGTLETLSLDMPLTSNTLIETLSLNPKLRFLEILNRGSKPSYDGEPSQDIPLLPDHTMNDSVLSALSHITEKGNHVLCPDLQHIRIINKAISLDTMNSILTFLEARVRHTKALRSCDIFFRYPPAQSTDSGG